MSVRERGREGRVEAESGLDELLRAEGKVRQGAWKCESEMRRTQVMSLWRGERVEAREDGASEGAARTTRAVGEDGGVAREGKGRRRRRERGRRRSATSCESVRGGKDGEGEEERDAQDAHALGAAERRERAPAQVEARVVVACHRSSTSAVFEGRRDEARAQEGERRGGRRTHRSGTSRRRAP